MNNPNVKVNKLVNTLTESVCARKGEVFIIPRSNKFYSSNKNEFYIVDNDGNSRELGRIMPLRDFTENYAKIVFYIFAREDKLGTINDILPEVISSWILSQ